MTDLESVIRHTMPKCSDPAGWAPHLEQAMSRFKIAADKDCVAVFLAQIAVESAELNVLVENLSYSAERLMAVWPKRFPTIEIARKYARNPVALANFVYGGRMGNVAPDDGYKFRGQGLKQLTGADNYKACGEALGVDLLKNPQYLQTKKGAADSAAWYWSSRGLSAIADDLPDDDDEADFRTVTQRVTGGATGLAERHKYWMRAKAALGLP